MTEKDFQKKFEELRQWIRSSVQVFADDSAEAKSQRIKLAEADKFYFARTYFPHYCEDEFAEIHSELFELSDTLNTPVVIAGAREIAKSTIISFFDELHKTLFKKNRFTVFICDTQETASMEFLLPIMAELEENQRITNDFGEQKTSLWSREDFVTKSGKRFLALGPKMGAKGKKHRSTRPDRIIIEDMENVNSPKRKAIIKQRLKWVLKDVLKSVNSKKWQFFFIGNYFSKKTILHHLLTSDDFAHWKRHIFPAYTTDKKGNIHSVWESRLSTKQLRQEQHEDPVTFRTERGQKPEDEEAVIREEWIRYFDDEDYNSHVCNLPHVTYVDPSALKGEEHCYKAIITLAVDKSTATYYVADAWIRKTSKWKMVDAHFDISLKYRSAIDGIEANGFQSTLEEDYQLIEEGRGQRLNLKMIVNRLPKDVRIGSLASPIERGYMKFRKDHSNVRELIEQLVDFPDGEFIDGPDALAGAKDIADTYLLKKKNKVKSGVVE